MAEATRDGCRITFEESGTGTPPLVLVHGWCCNRGFLEPQRRHFSARHRVITLDLPGHGESDRPQRRYSIPSFAADVAWLCERLTLTKPVIIGHSMGGAIALQLAADRPDLIAATVVLDTAVAPTAAIQHAWAELIERLHTPAYLDAARAAIERSYFIATDDAQRKARLIESMLATPQHVMTSAMEGIAAWDSIRAASGARVPVLNISSSAPRADVARFHELCPQLVHGQVVGAGHFLQLEVPDQVNAMIERFLSLYAAP
jgi:pimeloyl-ACP methyl ester carboxylesterase